MSSSMILDPAAGVTRSVVQSATAPGDLRGRTVAFIDNAKPNFNNLVDDLADVLVKDYGVAKVVKHRKRAASIPAPDSIYDEISALRADLVITGSGD
jgi:hypothetical protein